MTYSSRSPQCQLHFFSGLKDSEYILSFRPNSIPDYKVISMTTFYASHGRSYFYKPPRASCGHKADSLAAHCYHAKFVGTPLRSIRGCIHDALSLLRPSRSSRFLNNARSHATRYRGHSDRLYCEQATTSVRHLTRHLQWKAPLHTVHP